MASTLSYVDPQCQQQPRPTEPSPPGHVTVGGSSTWDRAQFSPPYFFQPHQGFRPGITSKHLDKQGLKPREKGTGETGGQALFRSPTLGQSHRHDSERRV